MTTTARAGWVLALTAIAQFVLQLDVAIVNVALHTIQRELGFTAVGLQWVVTGYALTFGSLLLVGGRLGDLIGQRRTLLAGLVLFGLTSLSGGLAHAPWLLVTSRIVQGCGAALVAPAALGLLTHAYTEPAARARALGIFQGGTAAGGTAGIVLGGILTQYAGWRWVLLVNPPVIVVLVGLILWRLPDTPGHARGGRLDVPGAVTVTGAVAALIYGVSEGELDGFGSPHCWGFVLLAVVLAAALVVVERTSADPMLPGAMLRDRTRVSMLGAVLIIGAVFAGYIYFIALYLQNILRYSAIETGIALVPATLSAFIAATQIARRLMPRMGPRGLLVLALALILIGQLWLAHVRPDGQYAVDVLPGIIFTPLGLGLAMPAASFAITSGAEPHQRGVAGGMFVTAQQIGAAAGLAILATVAATRTDHTGSLVDGYRLAYLIGAALIVVGLIGLLAVRPRRSVVPAPAEG
jgi:EmrB/QacA subfamily drug resistance transporter